jgi:4'-phosphopantetheinyl transferase EntD
VVSLDVDASPLFPEEAAAAAEMSAARRHEFALGRHCAHQAMAHLGVTPDAVPLGVGRAPVWPRSVIGSISHWGNWCVAAVMAAGEYVSFGIDGERRRRLPAGSLSEVATPSEHAWLESTNPAFDWDAALFSMKEAVYKAWAPVTGLWLEFKDVEIAVEPEAGTFCAAIRGADRSQSETTEIPGQFAFEGDSVLAVAHLQTPPGSSRNSNHGRPSPP